MKLGKLAYMIDDYTSASTVSVMLNGKVVLLYDREDFYIKTFLSYDEEILTVFDINHMLPFKGRYEGCFRKFIKKEL